MADLVSYVWSFRVAHCMLNPILWLVVQGTDVKELISRGIAIARSLAQCWTKAIHVNVLTVRTILLFPE